jgi:N-acetylneuraminic acid mutarotase
LSVALLVIAPATAQDSAVMSYGDSIGAVSVLEVRGIPAGLDGYLIPAMTTGGSPYLVSLSGDSNDMLTIDLGLAMAGTYFTGRIPNNGLWKVNVPLPNIPSYVDVRVYWQAFSRQNAAGADMFQHFSPVRTMSMNTPDRWQSSNNNGPAPSANLSFCTASTGGRGGITEVFISGGGPALLTDTSTPYPTINRAWMYDCMSDTHQLLPGAMTDGRAFHNSVKLQDGRFMVIGGIQGPYGSGNSYYSKVLNTCEIYDPATGTWTATATMSKYRAGSCSMVLPDGRVFVAGGTEGNNQHNVGDVADLLTTSLKTSEIYNPATNSWSSGPNIQEPKAGATGLVLDDGRFALIGGITFTTFLGIPIPDFSEKICVYDPVANSFNSQITMKDKRGLGCAAQLTNGQVYIAGGAGGDILNIGPIKKTEVWNPANNSTTRKNDLSVGVAFSGCVAMENGSAIVIGGARGDLDDPIPVNNVWLFNPSNGSQTSLAAMPETHGGGVVSLLDDGTILVSGGESNNGSATNAAITYSP